MKKELLVSVIVPIYNNEKYLDKCIISIMEQTYQNLEIILINDGSTDNSINICRKYQEKDSRIIYIEQKNSGVSKARNLGLDKARGTYIAFVDSDDFVEKNYIEKMLNAVIENNADICECNLNRLNDHYQFINSTNLYNSIIHDAHTIKLDFAKYNNSLDYVANKLIKKDVIGEQRFADLIVSEDYEFFVRIYENVKTKVTICDKLYNYIIYPKKLTIEKFSKNGLETIRARELTYEFYEKRQEFELAYMTAVQLLNRIMMIYDETTPDTQIILQRKYMKFYKNAQKAKDTLLKMLYRKMKFYKYKKKINRGKKQNF